MSIFLPYSVDVVINFFSQAYNLNLSTLTDYQRLILTIGSNIYFFLYWFIIIYFALKIFNRIYQRIF